MMKKFNQTESMMLHLISYSYPPDNVPAAHRPHQLVLYLEQIERPFRIYTRHRSEGSASAAVKKGEVSNAKRKIFALLSGVLRPLLEFDKAFPWGVRIFPRVWLSLMQDWLHGRKPPDIWATSPLPTNLYVAGLAAMLSGSRLHVDLRDAIAGINGKPMPLLTWLTLRYASSCSVVTDSLAGMVQSRAPFLKPTVIYNGISSDAANYASVHIPHTDGWIRLSYAGAIYGGERPYKSMLTALRAAAEALGTNWNGIELTFVSREDVSSIIEGYRSDRFRIMSRGEVAKNEALQLSAESDVNIVLIGSAAEHRCGIPLKIFDLLGVGRPVLYHGPLDADGCQFIQRTAPEAAFILNSENKSNGEMRVFADWLMKQSEVRTKPVTQPDAASQSEKILNLIK